MTDDQRGKLEHRCVVEPAMRRCVSWEPQRRGIKRRAGGHDRVHRKSGERIEDWHERTSTPSGADPRKDLAMPERVDPRVDAYIEALLGGSRRSADRCGNSSIGWMTR